MKKNISDTNFIKLTNFELQNVGYFAYSFLDFVYISKLIMEICGISFLARTKTNFLMKESFHI